MFLRKPQSQKAGGPLPPTYPPAPAGVPAESVEALFARYQGDLGRLELTFGAAAHTEAARHFRRVLTNFARYVHLLPLSRAGAFRGTGGQLACGLALARQCLIRLDESILDPDLPPEDRARMQPRWRIAILAAALLRTVHLPPRDLIVTDPAGEAWQPFLHPLADWLKERRCQEYYLCWRRNEDPDLNVDASLGPLLARHILTADILQYISPVEDLRALRAVIEALSGQGVGTTISDILEQATVEILRTDLESNPEYYGRPTAGVSNPAAVLGSILRDLAQSEWRVNDPHGGKLWYGEDGSLFLSWPMAAREIQESYHSQGQGGLPKDAEGIAEVLADSQIVSLNPVADRRRYQWKIAVECLDRPMRALRIARAEIVFPDGVPVAPIRISTEGETAARGEGNATTEGAGEQDARTEAKPDPEDNAATEPAETPNSLPLANTVLSAALEDKEHWEEGGQVQMLDTGVAVTFEAIKHYGVDPQELARELSQRQALYLDPMRPQVLQHAITVNGEAAPGLIIKHGWIREHIREGI